MSAWYPLSINGGKNGGEGVIEHCQSSSAFTAVSLHQDVLTGGFVSLPSSRRWTESSESG